MTQDRGRVMKKPRCCKNSHVDPQRIMSLALVRYNFSTPEIRLLMRHLLGHALSGRTIKRLARLAGNRLKRGRPPTTPRIHKGDISDLMEATSNGLDVFQRSHSSVFSSHSGPIRSHAPSVSQVGDKICSSREVHDTKLSPLRGPFSISWFWRQALPAVPSQ